MYLSICSFQAWNQCGSGIAFVFAGSYREGDDIEKGGSDGTTASARHNGKSEIGSKATVRVGARERKCIIVVMQRVCDSFGVARRSCYIYSLFGARYDCQGMIWAASLCSAVECAYLMGFN